MASTKAIRYCIKTDPPSERKEFASKYDAYIAIHQWLDHLQQLGVQSERDSESGRWTNTHRDGNKTQVWVEDEHNEIQKD